MPAEFFNFTQTCTLSHTFITHRGTGKCRLSCDEFIHGSRVCGTLQTLLKFTMHKNETLKKNVNTMPRLVLYKRSLKTIKEKINTRYCPTDK